MSYPDSESASPPSVLFVMTDQQRFDTIAALGHRPAITPNLDRLVRRGVSFTNAYSSCPVCVPARYSLMSGCEPARTEWFSNWEVARDVPSRCGPFMAAAMAQAGYRTWGLGKFHTEPRDEPLGFELQEYSEELWPGEQEYQSDDYIRWLRVKSPAFNHLEQVHGERTDMYYVPQCRAQPPAWCSESWLAERAEQEIARDDGRPYFGFVSFVQPHPPIAPPIPYNRLFDPDAMPAPTRGAPAVDAADDYLAWMNHAVWAEDISVLQARQLRARYCGAITFIDDCIGRILDAVEKRPDADNTIICFFSDHGDLLGDHGAWQKESFFEASCRVPLLISWPRRWAGGRRSDALVALTDLFGLATSVAGAADLRDGHDLMGTLDQTTPPRDQLIGMFGSPGGRKFKAMVRHGEWKYIWLANGGRELLFNVAADPAETSCWGEREPGVLHALRRRLQQHLRQTERLRPALDADGLLAFPFEAFPRERIKQFARGVTDFGQLEVHA